MPDPVLRCPTCGSSATRNGQDDDYLCSDCETSFRIMPRTDEELKVKVKNALFSLLTDARDKTSRFEEIIKSPHRVFTVAGKPNAIAIGPKGIVAFNEIIDVLVKDQIIGQKFSRRELETRVQSVASELLEVDSSEVQMRVESTVDMLLQLRTANPIDWKVYLPVENLVVHSVVAIGSTVIRMFDETTKTSIITQFDSIDRLTKTPLEVRDKLAQQFRERLTSDYTNRAVIQIETKAVDADRAIESAIDKAETSLNVLRFYSRGVIQQDARPYRMYVGLKGSISTGQLFATAFSESQFNTMFQNVGYFFKLDIDANAVKLMERDAFSKVHEILSKESGQRTAFEDLIVNSVNLFGIAMNNADTVTAFVTFVIALESILLKRAEPMKALLAERVALLLGTTYEERMFYFTQTSRLYQIRSDIVHRGFVDVTENDLFVLSMIGYRVLVRLIRESPRLNDIGKLVEMFNRQKFEPGTD